MFTYGGHLLEESFNHYDATLLSTVAWCMAHRPRERPTMLELEAILKDAIAREYPEEDDDDTRLTIRELLDSPSPPIPPPPHVEGV